MQQQFACALTLCFVAGCGVAPSASTSPQAATKAAPTPPPIPEEFWQGLSPQLREHKVNLDDPATAEEVAYLKHWLANTHELHIHRMRGAERNTVYLSPDGHSEGVYDSDGNLVSDLANQGSYNYAHPYQQPLAHFIADILPWLHSGNTSDDQTSVTERTEAYLQDLEDGLHWFFEKDQLPLRPSSGLEAKLNAAALAFFIELDPNRRLSKLALMPPEQRDAEIEFFMLEFRKRFSAALAEEIAASSSPANR